MTLYRGLPRNKTECSAVAEWGCSLVVKIYIFVFVMNIS